MPNDVHTRCAWCAGTPRPLPRQVKARDRTTGQTSKPRLCVRCIGPDSTFWRSHEPIDPTTVRASPA